MTFCFILMNYSFSMPRLATYLTTQLLHNSGVKYPSRSNLEELPCSLSTPALQHTLSKFVIFSSCVKHGTRKKKMVFSNDCAEGSSHSLCPWLSFARTLFKVTCSCCCCRFSPDIIIDAMMPLKVTSIFNMEFTESAWELRNRFCIILLLYLEHYSNDTSSVKNKLTSTAKSFLLGGIISVIKWRHYIMSKILYK